MKKSKLVEVDFRVCCNHRNTSRTCSHTINAIKKQFNNIVELNAVRPHGSAEDMCVIGTAMIRPSMKSRFENDLKKLKIDSDNARKIKKAVVALPSK